MENKPENNRAENPEDALERIKEIDRMFQDYSLLIIEEAGREIRWSETDEAKQLKQERSQIMEDKRKDPQFKLIYSGYAATREGKATARAERMRREQEEE